MNDGISFGKREERRSPDRTAFAPRTGGLTEAEAEESRRLWGRNELTRKKKPSLAADFFRNLSDPIIRILLCAMGINAALTFRNINWVEMGGIAFTVLTATLVSTISEHSSSAAFEKLERETKTAEFTVIRDGESRRVPSGDVVKGDLIVLAAGQVVPCDGVVVDGVVKVDQSSLTGESRPAEKKPSASPGEKIKAGGGDAADPGLVLAGSSVVYGECRAVAVAVGDATAYGKIASELQVREEPSPLKERLKKLAVSISKIGYAAAAVVALAYIFNEFVIGAGFDPAVIGARLSDLRFLSSTLLRALTVAVSVVVVAVPEGLPMMITVVLSANMKKMMKNGVIVKKLVGIETAGNMSLLFTDKTGTLTTGRMTAERVLTGDGSFTPGEVKRQAGVFRYIAAAAAFCSPPDGGNATGRAADSVAGAARPSGMRGISRLPFDSARKYAAALVYDEKAGEARTLIRGAPELVIPRCSSFTAADGTSLPLREKGSAAIASEIAGEEGDAVRVLAQATGPADAYEKLTRGEIPGGLCFTCAFFIKDEIRKTIRASADECREAGIKVIMITGDGKNTACAVAEAAGLLPRRRRDDSAVLSSVQIGAMSDEALAAALPGISVIYRVTPGDKSRLVRAARLAGHVVGMTGDGVNDAPALRAADVGFAMGSGAEVAKEAGDVVISDDDFSSITRAVLYGRTIFESIRKFITFQLIMNLCAVGVSVIGPLIGVKTPITIPQMLWINVIMDTLGSLAFAGEAPRKSFMKRAPRRREEPILSRDTVRTIVSRGLYSLSFFVWFLTSHFTKERFGDGDKEFLTAFFALFVFFGIANAMIARCDRINILAGMFSNAPFVLIMALVATVQLLLIGFGGEAFRTVPLSRGDLLLTAAFAVTVFPADLVFKLFRMRRRRKNTA
ncbi:MAG: calcium-translocating P-type ATPase, PMCA-type [Clostridia bacterium]|nr:calcium-translocating P-type ATPase, PMCA-type [Clostridia bacterium]